MPASTWYHVGLCTACRTIHYLVGPFGERDRDAANRITPAAWNACPYHPTSDFILQWQSEERLRRAEMPRAPAFRCIFEHPNPALVRRAWDMLTEIPARCQQAVRGD